MSAIQLRLVNKRGDIGAPLPDRRSPAYLDDDSDIGTVAFQYLQGGVNFDKLDRDQEIAVFLNGKEVRNGRFTIADRTKDTVADGRRWTSWVAQSILERLDDILVLPEKDEHRREDVITAHERQLLAEAREEWMFQQIKDAVLQAKDRAKSHNEGVRDRRTKIQEGATGPGDYKDLNHWGTRAIRWARGQITNRSQNWDHMCQSFVRQSFGLPGIYSTASEAWFAGRKRPNTPLNEIPPGVPVYWAPNHVALSTGGGFCISTDVLRAGWPDEVSIASLSNGTNWSLAFRGWSPDCSGRKVYP